MNEDRFDAEISQKVKRIAKQNNSSEWLPKLVAVVGSLGLMILPLVIIFAMPPEPLWANTTPQSAVGAGTNTARTWAIYGVIWIVFYVWSWRSDRTTALGFAVLQLLAFAGYAFLGVVMGVGGGVSTTLLTQLESDGVTYVLVTRNIVGNGKLDLYRCIEGQCRGREIAEDEWASYSGAELSIEGDPRQLIVNAGGTICFDLADFDSAMQTYLTRPEAGSLREGWQDGCR